MLYTHYKDKMLELSERESTFDVLEQGRLTAEMLIQGLQKYSQIHIEAEKKELLVAIIQWVCLVDAIDDYNEDIQKKRYNPLLTSLNNDIQKSNNLMIS